MIKSHLRPDRKYSYAVKLVFRLVNQTRQKKRRTHWRIQIIFTHGINTVHGFSFTHKAVCVHVTYTVANVHAICEGLRKALLETIP